MIHLKDKAAVVRNRDSVTILIESDAYTAGDLRAILAAVNSGAFVADVPENVRQLLHDLEAALFLAFRPRKAARPPIARPPSEV